MRARTTVAIVAGTCLAVVIGVARPDMAHLVVQGLLGGVVLVLLVDLLASVLRRLPSSSWASTWRRAPRRRPPVPRAIEDLATDLRMRGRHLPVRIVGLLAQQLDGRLAVRHGLDTSDPEQLELARALLSSHAFYLVSVRRHEDSRVRASMAHIPRSWLPHLLNELEHLRPR